MPNRSRWLLILVIVAGSAARSAVAGPADTTVAGPGARRPVTAKDAVRRPCRSRLSWYLEPTLWYGTSNSNTYNTITTAREIAVRNSGGVILWPCQTVSIRVGLAVSRYSGSEYRSHPQQLRFVDSALGVWGFGPEVEVDLVRLGHWRLGVAGGLEIGEPYEYAWPHTRLPVILRVGARARWRGALLGIDVVHGNGATNYSYIPDPDPEMSGWRAPEAATAVMFGAGLSGDPPWIALGLELVLYAALMNHYARE